MAPRRNTRALLTDAARLEFADHGFAGARTDRIARRAGVNKQLLFYYFGSKAGLYQAVMREATQALERAAVAVPRGDGHASERLRKHLETVFDALCRRADLARLLVEGHGPSDAASSLDGLVRELGRTISEGEGLGYFRDDVDPDLAARQAVVLLVGYLAMEDAVQPASGPDRQARWLDGVTDYLLRALSW